MYRVRRPVRDIRTGRSAIRANLCAVAVIAFGAPNRDRCRRRYAPKSLWLRIRLHAARRNAPAARFFPFRVALDFIAPPVFFQLGHSPS